MSEAAAAGSTVDESGKIPAKSFFGNPLFSQVKLSPNGRRVAVLLSRNESEAILSIDLQTGERVGLALLERSDASHSLASLRLSRMGWASDDTVVMSMSKAGSARGIKIRSTVLFASDVRNPRAIALGEDWPYASFKQFQDLIIDYLPDEPDRIMVNWFGAARLVEVSASRLRASIIERKGVGGWGTDHKHKVRVGFSGQRYNTEFGVWGRVTEDDRIERLVKWDPLSVDETGMGFYFAGFSDDPKIIYVFSERETGRFALYEFDLQAKKMGRLVFGHPKYEVDSINTSAVDGRLLAVHYTGKKSLVHFVDDEYRRLWEPIHEQFAGSTVTVVSTDLRETRSIFAVSASDEPPTYYLLNHRSGASKRLFRARPTLDGQILSKMEPIEYRARDGLMIEGYVTRPSGVTGPSAAIVMPHGGPFVRDVSGWDPVVQFLVSRGFTVLQPNYRGSTGYGRKFREAGYKQFGRAMQDDITDGVRWLIDQGIADPARIGIYGGSYGGYAALQGLVSTPDLYAAGASYAGFTDVVRLLNDESVYGYDAANKVLIGSRWTDRDFLAEISPAFHADKIRVPVLLAHGTDDPTVHIRHTDGMATALEEAGAEFELYRYFGETHGFLDERSRIDFYQKLGDFFERHLHPNPAHIARPVKMAGAAR